jgi:hypothetical protein
MTVRLSTQTYGKQASLIGLFAAANFSYKCQLIVQKTIETTSLLLRMRQVDHVISG